MAQTSAHDLPVLWTGTKPPAQPAAGQERDKCEGAQRQEGSHSHDSSGATLSCGSDAKVAILLRPTTPHTPPISIIRFFEGQEKPFFFCLDCAGPYSSVTYIREVSLYYSRILHM